MAGQVATEVALDEEALQGFTMGVRGPVLVPGYGGYHEARPASQRG